ncbi:MAG: response regulator, partial [Fibrobacteria bacterium]|nr:response regulator [Fibrobacteria bacterium]
TIEALKEVHLANMLHIVQDGEKALDFLYKRGEYAKAILPDLILLDWNLPRKSGKEVLAEIKGHPVLRKVPVVVLTSSNQENDILESYNLHANCFITKPVDLDQFIKVINSIESFWLTIVKRIPR